MAFRIHRGIWQFQKADGAYESKYKLNTEGQIVETDVDGNEIGGMTASVAWTSVSGRPTTLSSFTNDLGNYGGFLTSVTSHNQGAATISSGTFQAGRYSFPYQNGITGSSVPNYSNSNIEIYTDSNHVPTIGFHRGGVSATALYEYDGQLYVKPWTTRAQIGILLSSGNIGSYAWTSGNDGSGSGLDADLLDGLHSGSFVRSDADTSTSGYFKINKDWGGGDYGAESLTIRGQYPSITLRSSNANFKWLLHTDASGNFRFYTGSGYDDNAWTNRFTFTAGNHFYVESGNVYANGGNSTQWNTAYGWGNHAGLYAAASHTHSEYLKYNPDGDGIAISYDDSNPTINGIGVGGGHWFGADGSTGGGYLAAKILHAEGSTSSIGGYFTGAMNISAGGNSTQVIDGSGNWVGNAIGDSKISSASNWNTAYGWGNHASAGYAASSHSHSYLPLSGGTLTGQLNMHAGSYEGSIVFGSNSIWRTGIRQHDDADAELRIWAKHASGMIFLATGYDGEPADIARPTDGLAIQGNKLGIGDFSAGDPSYKLHVKGTGYFSDTLTLTNISGAAQTVPNTYGAYLHLGSWADGRTAAGAVLVNTAYRADYATSLFDMNISRFTNNSGYITAYGAQGANGNFYIDDNYGYGIVGAYSSTRYQGVFAMGDAYKLSADGTSPGSLYGLAWTHTNVGGQSKAGLGHQLLVMMNGTTYTALGDGIWTSGTITTTSHGTSANWNTAYGWGNHASAGYASSSHNHSGVYAPVSHTHEIEDVNLLQEVLAEIDGLISGKAASSHTHDDRYYTESESLSLFARKDTNSAIGGNLVIGNGTYGNLTAYGNSGARLMFSGSDTDAQGNYYIGTNHQDYGGNYSKLDLRWHTGIRMGAQAGYGGIRFFDNEDLNTRIMSIGETDGNVRIDNNLWIGGAGGWITDLLAGKQAAGSYAAASHEHDRTYITDSRGAARAPSYYNDRYAQWDFQNVADTGVGGDGWHALLTVSKWSAYDPSHRQEQLIFSGDHLWRRTATSDSAWGTNKKIWDSGNFDPDTKAASSHNHDGVYLAAGGKAADSNLLDGLDLHTGRNNEANKVVRTDGNGYIQAGWINTPSGATTSTLTKIYASQDDYIRYVTPAEFRRQITDGVYQPAGSYQAAGSYAASSHTHTPSEVGLGNVSNAAQVTTSYNSSLNSDSRNSRGVTRLYRRDSDSDYSVQTYWTGARWRLYGYSGDSNHADTHVGYADSAGSASSATSATSASTATNLSGANVVTSGNNLYIYNSGAENYRLHHNGQGGVFDSHAQFAIRPASTDFPEIRYILNDWVGYFWYNVDPWGDNWGIGPNPYSWAFVNRGSMLTFGFEDWSDRRHKSAITEIDNAVDKVKAISGYTYWKRGSEVKEAGVVAQDVLEVFPEAVGGNEEGYSIKPSALIGLLSKAVKEQQEMIDALTARIEALENK